MQFEISKRFIREELPASPEIIPREEFIKLAISSLSYDDGLVSLKFHISYMFPDSLALRYQYLDEGLVIVVNDVDQQDCLSTNFTSDAYVPSPGTQLGSNLITKPPLSLPVPDEEELKSLSGGWVNGDLSFASPNPRSSPNIFLYIVLENYFSNVVGIDLFDKKAIYF
jgi:hypothetical protein